jgi:hypothetical protein
MAAANSTDDFFGVGMAGANPYANRYAPVHQMQQQSAQTAIAKQQAMPAPQQQPQVQPNMPQGWNNMFKGQQLNRSSNMDMARTQIAPYTNEAGRITADRSGGATSGATSRPLDPETGRPLNPDGSVMSLTEANNSVNNNGGGSNVPYSPTTQSGNVPQDLPALRNTLQSYMLDRLNSGEGGRWDPIFSRDDLTINPDPAWGTMNTQLYNQLGAANDMTHQGFDAFRNLMGRPITGGADLSQLNPWMAASQAGAGGLQGLMQAGGGNTLNPEIMQMMMQGQGMQSLNRASMNPSMIDPNLRSMAQNGIGMSTLQQLAQTGGRGNLQPQLDAIRTQGMQGIEDQLAQIREQYGMMGLGAGSDIADALGRGASRGYADIVRQQSELAYGADQAANNMMFQAGGAEQGANANLMNMIGNLNLGGQGQSIQAGMGIQDSLGSMLNTYSNAMSGSYGRQVDAGNALMSGANQGMGTYGNLLQGNVGLTLQDTGQRYQGAAGMVGAGGQMSQNLSQLIPGMMGYAQNQDAMNIGNLQRYYEETLRQAGGPPMLDKAIGYATNYPQQQPYQKGSSGWPGAIGSIAGGVISALPWMAMMSSRDLKEDIAPATGFLSKLEELPLHTWRYKGDPVKHIGPMAQDFQKVFGVGDGQTLHFGDMLSVIMGGLKEMSHGRAAN